MSRGEKGALRYGQADRRGKGIFSVQVAPTSPFGNLALVIYFCSILYSMSNIKGCRRC